MARPRLSIFGLGGLIALVALALASLLHASAPWAAIVRVGYFASLASAPLGVVYFRRGRRAFYLGFALWAWLYLFVLFASEPITEEFLAWAYQQSIPVERQAKEQKLLGIVLQNITLDEDLSADDLSGRVDIRDQGALVAQGALIVTGGPSLIQPGAAPVPTLDVRVDANAFGRLSNAVLLGSKLTVSRHRPGMFSALSESPPVAPADFDGVGHAVIGLFAGAVGGLVGLWFHAIRDADRVTSA